MVHYEHTVSTACKPPCLIAGIGIAADVLAFHANMGAASGSRCTFPQSVAFSQGLTLVHLTAQLEPCLTQENTLHTLNTPFTRATQPLRAPPIPLKALKLS
jgi:hypothetical protein